MSSVHNELNDPFSSSSFCLKSKVIEGSRKGKKFFFNFWVLFLKICIFKVLTFFSYLEVIQWTQFFSGSTYD